MKTRQLTVEAAEAGALLDFLARRLDLSRRKAKELLDSRSVLVNDRRVWMARHEVRRDDRVTVPSARHQLPAFGPVQVLWRDACYAVVAKPAGLLSNGPRSLETAVRERMGSGTWEAVHRLDRDTSGCLLLAENPAARDQALALFRRREIAKAYEALVLAAWPRRITEIRTPIAGKSALTRVIVIASTRQASRLKLSLETGRTHQIRKHVALQGHPVLGDRTYATGKTPRPCADCPRQMLHARSLKFAHPLTGHSVYVRAPLPPDFQAMCKALGLAYRGRPG